MSVARDAGRILNNGLTATEDAIEQGGFTHVRAADDGDSQHYTSLSPSRPGGGGRLLLPVAQARQDALLP